MPYLMQHAKSFNYLVRTGEMRPLHTKEMETATVKSEMH